MGSLEEICDVRIREKTLNSRLCCKRLFATRFCDENTEEKIFSEKKSHCYFVDPVIWIIPGALDLHGWGPRSLGIGINARNSFLRSVHTGRRHGIVLYRYRIFLKNWMFAATLRPTSPLGPFSQQRLLTWVSLCHIWVMVEIFQTSKKITTRWRLRWWLAPPSDKVCFN